MRRKMLGISKTAPLTDTNCRICTGDRIVVVVQKQRAATSEGSSGTALANKVRRGDIRHAVVVRVKKELQRADGTVVRFGDNACVLVNKSGDPIGTRMNGEFPISSAREWQDSAMLSPRL